MSTEKSSQVSKADVPPLNIQAIDDHSNQKAYSSRKSSAAPTMRTVDRSKWRHSMDFSYLTPRTDKKPIVQNMDAQEQSRVANLQKQAMVKLGFIHDTDKFEAPILQAVKKIKDKDAEATYRRTQRSMKSMNAQQSATNRQQDNQSKAAWMLEALGFKPSSKKTKAQSPARTNEKAEEGSEKSTESIKSSSSRPLAEKTESRKEIVSPDGTADSE
jgi:hypothetical protein